MPRKTKPKVETATIAPSVELEAPKPPTPPKVSPAPSAKLPVVGGNYFSSVRKARAALRERAFETYEKLQKIIDMAAAAGDFETAGKYAWMLIEHTPDEDGETVIAGSAAKPKMVEAGPRGPTIQIGVRVGGVGQPQLEEPIIIDVIPDSQ